MRLSTAFALLALWVSVSTFSFAQTPPPDAPKPWVQTTIQGFSFYAPVSLAKQELGLPPEQRALTHSHEFFWAHTGDLMIYSMFIHLKTTTGSLQGGFENSIRNVVSQLKGTDLQMDYLDQTNEKNALLVTASFNTNSDRMIVKGYGYLDMKGKSYMVVAIGKDNLPTQNILTRILTSVKIP